jgi:catalase
MRPPLLLRLCALLFFAVFTTHATTASPVPNQEVIPPGEAQATAALLHIVETSVATGWKQNGLALRDAHAKAHGCVLAHFKVRGGLAPVYRVAVFARPTEYDAFIRFSNGSDDVEADTKGDGRGMAIKLLGIPGRKLIPSEADAQTQDFVAINYPVFFSRDAADYLAFFKAKQAHDFAPYFATHQREFEILTAINSKKIHDVLDETYFSMTPFELGDRYMKYRMRPERCPNAPQLAPLPASTAFDYLRTDLVHRLAEGPACYAFEIQLQTDPKTMPIEDATVEWPESQSPYVPVADITIDRQSFNSPAQNTFCEDLSYTVWHALPSLRPVGGLNRIRLPIYQAISKLRHQLNDAPRKEPTVSTFTAMESHP